MSESPAAAAWRKEITTNPLPQFTALLFELAILPRGQRRILAACDEALAAQLRADAERLLANGLPLGTVIRLWELAPIPPRPIPTEYPTTLLDSVHP